jgi:hypothetical protein
MDDIEVKIARLEDQMFGHLAANPASPAVLLACLNLFRDWVDVRREAMVDAVIARTRELLNEWTPVATRPPGLAAADRLHSTIREPRREAGLSCAPR